MFEYKVTLRTYKKVADVKRGWKGPEHEKITQDMWTWVESHKDSNNQLKAVFDAGKEGLPQNHHLKKQKLDDSVNEGRPSSRHCEACSTGAQGSPEERTGGGRGKRYYAEDKTCLQTLIFNQPP